VSRRPGPRLLRPVRRARAARARCEPGGPRLRVALLLSGGVDSSLALRLLQAAGHSVTAFYLQIWFEEDFRNSWDACPWEADLDVAQRVRRPPCLRPRRAIQTASVTIPCITLPVLSLCGLPARARCAQARAACGGVPAAVPAPTLATWAGPSTRPGRAGVRRGGRAAGGGAADGRVLAARRAALPGRDARRAHAQPGRAVQLAARARPAPAPARRACSLAWSREAPLRACACARAHRRA